MLLRLTEMMLVTFLSDRDTAIAHILSGNCVMMDISAVLISFPTPLAVHVC